MIKEKEQKPSKNTVDKTFMNHSAVGNNNTINNYSNNALTFIFAIIAIVILVVVLQNSNISEVKTAESDENLGLTRATQELARETQNILTEEKEKRVTARRHLLRKVENIEQSHNMFVAKIEDKLDKKISNTNLVESTKIAIESLKQEIDINPTATINDEINKLVTQQDFFSENLDTIITLHTDCGTKELELASQLEKKWFDDISVALNIFEKRKMNVSQSTADLDSALKACEFTVKAISYLGIPKAFDGFYIPVLKSEIEEQDPVAIKAESKTIAKQRLKRILNSYSQIQEIITMPDALVAMDNCTLNKTPQPHIKSLKSYYSRGYVFCMNNEVIIWQFK